MKRDLRTREEILSSHLWDKLRAHPNAADLSIGAIRVADQFFEFCDSRGIRDLTAEHVLAFDPCKSPSRLARLLTALRALYGLEHPATHVVERARQAKCRAHRAKKRSDRSKTKHLVQASCSLSSAELPAHWLQTLEGLAAGQRIKGRAAALSSVRNMRNYARQLVFAAREDGAPEDFELRSLTAYHAALEERGLRSSSIEIQFRFLGRLAFFVGADADICRKISAVISYYRGKRLLERKRKEDQLLNLPDLGEIFWLADRLKSEGSRAAHATIRNTKLVDAAVVTFLSLVPLRNEDTVLRWGKDISLVANPKGAWIYQIDTRISKTLVNYNGILHPILNSFLEAVLLQGRHEAFLPRLRAEAIRRQAPVFPKSTGEPRNAQSLSRRWAVNFGMGSHIARTRLHTVLGQMGPEGVEAALSLCAQRSVQTRKEYQAEAYHYALIRQGQVSLASTLPREMVETHLRATLGRAPA